MSILEKRNNKRVRVRDLQQIILHTIATIGVVGIGLLAPNVIRAMSKLGILPRARQKEYVSSAASKLRQKGFLKFEGGQYQLTTDGEKLLRHWEFANYKLKIPSRWDRKWRVLIFDIPEKKKVIRNQLTLMLRQAGFERLQDSVWVYPYDCEDIIGLLKTDFGIGRNLLYLIVDEIENDKHLRQQFKL